MDLAKLIQLLMSMQNNGNAMPDLSALFENRQADPEPKPETAPHSGWEPDPDRAGATGTGPSGSSEQADSSDSGSSGGMDLSKLLPLLLQMMGNQNPGSADGANADSGAGGMDPSKLLPLFLQMMGNQSSGGTDEANTDSGAGGMDLSKLLPLFLQMMGNQNSGGTDGANADSGIGGMDLSKILPVLMQMMNRQPREKEAEPESEPGWSESEFAPNDVRRQTERAAENSNQPHGADDGPVRTRPAFDDSGYRAQAAFAGSAAPDWAEAPPRTRAAEGQTPEPAGTNPAGRAPTPRGLLPVAFAPPSMIYRLNLYFAHADA